MVKLYPSGQGQSCHDWPRSIPRARSGAWYANGRLRCRLSFFRCSRAPQIFLTHLLYFSVYRSLLLCSVRCPSATIPKKCTPCLSFTLFFSPPPLPPNSTPPLPTLSHMTAVTHDFYPALLDLCGNQSRIRRFRSPQARVRNTRLCHSPRTTPSSSPFLAFHFLFCRPNTGTGTRGLTHVRERKKNNASNCLLSAHRNLTTWAEAGVLMLNTCLTVRAHAAGSHQGKGWEQFTDRVIDTVDRYGGANLGDKTGLGRGVVFLAWGSWAAKRVAKLSKVRKPSASQPSEHCPESRERVSAPKEKKGKIRKGPRPR